MLNLSNGNSVNSVNRLQSYLGGAIYSKPVLNTASSNSNGNLVNSVNNLQSYLGAAIYSKPVLNTASSNSNETSSINKRLDALSVLLVLLLSKLKNNASPSTNPVTSSGTSIFNQVPPPVTSSGASTLGEILSSLSNKNSTVIGANTQALNTNSTAIGTNTEALNTNSTAIGANTQALNNNTTSLDRNSVSLDKNTSVVQQTIDRAILQNKSPIELFYKDILGREADAGGLAFWKAQVNSGALTLDGVAHALRNSAEALGTTAPAAAGAGAATPAPAAAAAGSGAATPAPAAAATSTASAISQVYSSALGRAPDAGGAAFWQGQVDSGKMTVAQVTDAIRNSPEALGKK
ncbi:MAG: DUF4214 domain-containing protein [Vampirovibrionales bacterium]